MHRASVIRGYRLVFAVLTFAAIAYQLSILIDRGTLRLSNFFSFFTIESNVLAATLLLYLAVRDPASAKPRGLELIRGAAVTYMVTTGIVYGLLLSGLQEALQTTIPWVDTVLHRVMPLVMIVDWVLDPPRRAFGFRNALIWLIFPLAYCFYSLIRGPIVDWYPYPFLNPDQTGGYLAVAAYCVGIAVGVLLITEFVVWVGQRVRLVVESRPIAAT